MPPTPSLPKGVVGPSTGRSPTSTSTAGIAPLPPPPPPPPLLELPALLAPPPLLLLLLLRCGCSPRRRRVAEGRRCVSRMAVASTPKAPKFESRSSRSAFDLSSAAAVDAGRPAAAAPFQLRTCQERKREREREREHFLGEVDLLIFCSILCFPPLPCLFYRAHRPRVHQHLDKATAASV